MSVSPWPRPAPSAREIRVASLRRQLQSQLDRLFREGRGGIAKWLQPTVDALKYRDPDDIAEAAEALRKAIDIDSLALLELWRRDWSENPTRIPRVRRKPEGAA